jgi:hypothetical protein
MLEAARRSTTSTFSTELPLINSGEVLTVTFALVLQPPGTGHIGGHLGNRRRDLHRAFATFANDEVQTRAYHAGMKPSKARLRLGLGEQSVTPAY